MGETRPLYKTSEWNFDTMRRTYDAIAEVAERDLGLDTYPNQIEIISTEQMLDAYSSIGMPLMYQHWSFGKHFARDEVLYRKGFAGLACMLAERQIEIDDLVVDEKSGARRAVLDVGQQTK